MSRIVAPYAELLRAKNGEFYFVTKAGNHRVIDHSETYKKRASALKSARKVLGLHVYERDEAGKLQLIGVT